MRAVGRKTKFVQDFGPGGKRDFAALLPDCLGGHPQWSQPVLPEGKTILWVTAYLQNERAVPPLVKQVKWTPVSRPIWFGNKLTLNGSGFEFWAAPASEPPVAIPAPAAALRSHPLT